MGKSGISAEIPRTLIDEWQNVLAQFGTQPALSVKRGGKWVNKSSFRSPLLTTNIMQNA
jgi:hypothetical protein